MPAGVTAPLTPVGFNDLSDLPTVESTDRTYVYDASAGLLKTSSMSSIGNAARRVISVTLSANQDSWNPAGLASADVIQITISGNYAYRISGLQGGVDGRIITLMNISSTGSVILSGEDSASTAAYRLALYSSPVIAVGPGDAVSLMYSSTLSRWYAIARNMASDSTGGMVGCYSNSMIAKTTGAIDLTESVNGTGASTSRNAAAAGNGGGGEIVLTTGTTAGTGRAGIGTTDMALLANGASYRIFQHAIFTPSALSDGTNIYTIRSGMLDSISAEPSDAIMLRYVHSANSAKWLFVARKATVEGTADTGITFAIDTFIQYAIVVYGSLATPSTDLYMSSGGAPGSMARVATITSATTVPVATANAMGIGTSILKGGAGGTSRIAYFYGFTTVAPRW